MSVIYDELIVNAGKAIQELKERGFEPDTAMINLRTCFEISKHAPIPIIDGVKLMGLLVKIVEDLPTVVMIICDSRGIGKEALIVTHA